MSALTDRLRDHQNGGRRGECEEAADEIERLTTSLAKMKADWEELCQITAKDAAEIKRLTAENEALSEVAMNAIATFNRESILAAQVVTLNGNLRYFGRHFPDCKWQSLGPCNCKFDKALSLDLSAAEAVLREREAKVLEEAADKFHCLAKRGQTIDGLLLTPMSIQEVVWVETEIRRLAAERGEGK